MIRKFIIWFIYIGIFVFLPYIYVYFNLDRDNFDEFIAGLGYYIFFISPFLFPIFFYFAKLKNWKERILFVLFGFIIPFAIIYYFLYLDFQKNFHPGF